MTRVFSAALVAGVAAAAGVVSAGSQAAATATVTVVNPAAVARPSETIELAVSALQRVMTFDDVRKIHVKDSKTGRDLLTQAVDLNDDGTFEQLILQVDMAASETRTLTLSLGERRIPVLADFKAYGRFVRERRDDFVWENDLVAHRTYGAALETWMQEPLTSSAIDVWVKKTKSLVANGWYLVDDYHEDHGDGGDFYSAGKTRGCGGNGIWQDGKLYASANFRNSRVLANGPIRVLFELTYNQWDAGGQKVAETKKVSLDAGQRMNRFESTYAVPGPRQLMQAAGIKKLASSDVSIRREQGILRTWEAFTNNNGNLGCGVVVDPRDLTDTPEADGNILAVTRVAAGTSAVYWAGSAWDRGGSITSAALWDQYLNEWAQRLRAPVTITVGK